MIPKESRKINCYNFAGPVRMERVAADVEGLHLRVADLDAHFVGPLVERAFDFQAGFGRCRADQFDHGDPIGERPAAPVLRDVAEQAVLDAVPFGRARWIVVNVDDEIGT